MVNFPIVPMLPGVPALLRDPAAIINTGTSLLPGLPVSLLGHEGNFLLDNVLLLADNQGLFDVGQKLPQWGLFKDGEPVVTADNVLALEYTSNWNVANYPIEQGAFESYDKVNDPFKARIRFSSGGTEQNRQQLIGDIAAIAGNLELYDLVTPEVSYSSVNIERFDYVRSAKEGAGLIVIDVMVTEVRTTAVAEFTNTKSPSGADSVSSGNVNPKDLTSFEHDKLVKAAVEGLDL